MLNNRKYKINIMNLYYKNYFIIVSKIEIDFYFKQ